MSELLGLLAGAGVEPALAAKLAAYGDALLAANARVNLTGAKSPEALAPHLLDALTLLPHVQGPAVDVGSGGGLPAIPLAIALDIPVTMIESVAKKAAFLTKACADLGITSEVLAIRAEDAGRAAGVRESFATATARAVSSAPAVAELLLPLVRIGGTAVMPRGSMEGREREALADAALMLGGKIENEVVVDGERRIVIVRKVAATPQRFPRRSGIPEKRPLCL